MYSLTEHGLLLNYPSEEEFSFAKDKLDRIAKSVRNELKHKTSMHAIAIPDCGGNLLFTCYLQDDMVRFGIYDTFAKTLVRDANIDIINKIDKTTVHMLISRLMSASQKEIPLPPLDELWELSIQKELPFTDVNGIVELKDPTVLNVSKEELQTKTTLEYP